MDSDSLFSIGEMAKLFHISTGSLRHYEDEGLLVPEKTDPCTGYRYYSTRQFEPLNTIRYLRMLGMPLPQIADFLKNKDIDLIEEKLTVQKRAIAEKIHELQIIERKIDNRLSQLRDAVTSELNSIKLCETKACRIIWIDCPLKIKSALDMEAPIRKLEESRSQTAVFLGKVGLGISKERLCRKNFETYDRIFIVLDDEEECDGNVELLPATKCVCVRFCGSHTEAPDEYRRLISFTEENNLIITGFSREITMIDYGITNDTSKFVTEIRIPVSERME